MADDSTIKKFIELRSQGMSFKRISDQLGVAKSTLIDWSHKHQHTIQNLRAVEWEEFIDSTLVTRRQNIQTLAQQLARLQEEFEKRDLSTVPTPQIQTMMESVRRRLHRETGAMQFTTGLTISVDDETREAIQIWNP